MIELIKSDWKGFGEYTIERTITASICEQTYTWYQSISKSSLREGLYYATGTLRDFASLQAAKLWMDKQISSYIMSVYERYLNTEDGWVE